MFRVQLSVVQQQSGYFLRLLEVGICGWLFYTHLSSLALALESLIWDSFAPLQPGS